MGLPAAELDLFTVADLDTFGMMTEALSEVAPEVKASAVAAAIGEVLSWLPNATRPIVDIGEDLKDDIGVIAISKLLPRFRGLSTADLDVVKFALEQTMARRALIIAPGAENTLRPYFVDSTPNADDFSTIGGGALTSDAWVQP